MISRPGSYGFKVGVFGCAAVAIVSLGLASVVRVGFFPIELLGALVGLASAGVIARRRVEEQMWAWIVLFVLLMGYVVKSFAFLLWTEYLGGELAELDWVRVDDVVNGFLPIGTAFLAFGLAASWLARGYRSSSTTISLRPPDHGVLRSVIVIAIALGVITTVIPFLLGFGAMGVAHQPLPFRLDIPITRMRVTLVPAVLACCAWIADRHRMRSAVVLAIGGLVGVALLDAVVRGSRGSLVLFVLPVLLTWIVEDRVTLQRRWGMVAFVATFLVLHPVLSAVRYARMFGDVVSVGAVLDALRSGDLASLFSGAFVGASMRVSGADGVWWVGLNQPTAWNWQFLSLFLQDGKFTQIFTWDIIGVAREADWRAPTLLGVFLFIGGLSAVAALTFAWSGVLAKANQWVSRLHSAPAALGIFGTFCLIWVSEGKFGIREPIGLVIALILVEILTRWLCSSSRSTGQRDSNTDPLLRQKYVHWVTVGAAVGLVGAAIGSRQAMVTARVLPLSDVVRVETQVDVDRELDDLGYDVPQPGNPHVVAQLARASVVLESSVRRSLGAEGQQCELCVQEAISRLRRNLRVSVRGATGVVSFQLASSDVTEATSLIEGVIAAIDSVEVRRRQGQAITQADLLRRLEHERVEEERRAERTRTAFLDANRLIAGAPRLEERLRALDNDLVRARDERARVSRFAAQRSLDAADSRSAIAYIDRPAAEDGGVPGMRLFWLLMGANCAGIAFGLWSSRSASKPGIAG